MTGRRATTVLAGMALVLVCTVGAGSAQAQATAGRWTFEAGVAGAPIGVAGGDVFAGASARVATTGPLEWAVGAAVYGLATVNRADMVSVAMYCPGGCREDRSEMRLPVAVGATVRLVGLPWIFNRIVPEFGTGGYYARWRNLPDWDAQRPSLTTGYRLVALGLRLTKRVGVSVGAMQFLNARNRDDRAVGRIAGLVRWP